MCNNSNYDITYTLKALKCYNKQYLTRFYNRINYSFKALVLS